MLIKKGNTKIIIQFNPAFHEKSDITIFDSVGQINLSVFLKNYHGIDQNEDTFYYLNKKLDLKESVFIDTAIKNLFVIKIPKKEPSIILDGITLSLQSINGVDTNFIFMHSPDSLQEKEKFSIAVNTINNLKQVINDTIVIGYLNEMLSYFGDTKMQMNTPIIRLRELKYNIKYRR